MMKKIFIFAMSLFCFTASTVSSARVCPQALPISSPGFCTSFQQAAACQCENYLGSTLVCANMNLIYNAMLARYDLPTACSPKHQKETSQQICMDDWSCYRTGKTYYGAWCNGAHKAAC